jgi:hypothetical protein
MTSGGGEGGGGGEKAEKQQQCILTENPKGLVFKVAPFIAFLGISAPPPRRDRRTTVSARHRRRTQDPSADLVSYAGGAHSC